VQMPAHLNVQYIVVLEAKVRDKLKDFYL
jgi:hypothetical protein